MKLISSIKKGAKKGAKLGKKIGQPAGSMIGAAAGGAPPTIAAGSALGTAAGAGIGALFGAGYGTIKFAIPKAKNLAKKIFKKTKKAPLYIGDKDYRPRTGETESSTEESDLSLINLDENFDEENPLSLSASFNSFFQSSTSSRTKGAEKHLKELKNVAN